MDTGEAKNKKPGMSLKEKAYDYLVNEILGGKLKPGDRISEAKLAKEFGISRTPVRAAMQELANGGILESRINCNTTVAQWNDEKILQLEIVRTDLENLAAKLAIIYGSNNDFREMHIHSEACYKASLNNDICTLLKEDVAFHMEIARIAKNDQLYKFMDEIHKQNRFLLCWRKDFLIPGDKQYRQHEEIIESFVARDENRVLRLLTHHNRHSFKVNDDMDYFTKEFFLRGVPLEEE